jgi:hypothetical protein
MDLKEIGVSILNFIVRSTEIFEVYVGNRTGYLLA